MLRVVRDYAPFGECTVLAEGPLSGMDDHPLGIDKRYAVKQDRFRSVAADAREMVLNHSHRDPQENCKHDYHSATAANSTVSHIVGLTKRFRGDVPPRRFSLIDWRPVALKPAS